MKNEKKKEKINTFHGDMAQRLKKVSIFVNDGICSTSRLEDYSQEVLAKS